MRQSSSRLKALAVTAGFSLWFFIISSITGLFSFEALIIFAAVTLIITQITGGIRSGLSYCGAHSIKEMQENAEFIKISRAGFAESQPHDVDVM